MGWQTCPRCKGYNSKAQRCPMCGNAPLKRPICDNCNGKGTVACPSCRGSGKVFVGNRP